MDQQTKSITRAILRNSSGHYQLVRFGVVGVVSTFVFYAVSNATFVLSHRSVLSSAVGWVVSLFVSFFGHGYFTYRSECDITVFTPFFVLALWNLGVIQAITVLGTHSLQWPYWLTTLAIVIAVPIVSFAVGRYLVFRPNTRPR